MRILALGVAVGAVAFAAVGNVSVRGVSATQAILSYTAPDAGACTVEVSESANYSPLVHDVDPGLFPGSNLDSRAESLSSGRMRVFVAGKRRAEKSPNGHWYSRALQTVTTHYYRITCGSSQATGTFQTANLALGNSYNDTMPADPAVASRPYFATMGSYGWPEFVNWNNQDPTARPESVIDPYTGVLLKRMGLPQDAQICCLPGTGDHYFTAVRSLDGAWQVGTTTWSIANGKLVKIVVGSGTATVTTSTAHGLAVNSNVAINGLAVGNGIYSVNSVTSTTFQISQGSLPSNVTLTDATLQVTAYAGAADTGATTNFTGSNSNFVLLRDDTFFTDVTLSEGTLPTDYFTVSVKGWCSGTCAGEDAKIQACLTINGVNCWPTNATAKFQEVTLGTSQTNNYVVLGTIVPVLDSWTPTGFQPLNKSDLSQHMSKANIDTNGLMTWVANGSQATYFDPNWTAGSRVWIKGSECVVNAPASAKSMSIDPASCSTPLALPLTGVSWFGNNLGWMIRKKTPSTDTIRVQFAKYSTAASQHMEWNASGSAKLCGDTLVQNPVTGGYGYHCLNFANLPMMYWIDRKTGDANYLGMLVGGSSGGADGYDNCYGNLTVVGSTPLAPEHYYCVTDDNETPSKRVLVSCTVTTNNQPGNLAIGCANTTPGSQGKDLGSLIAAFTAGDTPAYNAALFGCGVGGLQGTKLVISCGRSWQDTIAWVVMFDPNKVGTAPGCVGGGKPGCVVAAMSTWGHNPARWCVLHTLFISGKTDTVWIAGKYMIPYSPAQTGDGPHTSTITAGTLGATPAIAAGTGACPAGSAGCDQITVDGEPCDPLPASGEAASSPCPKNSSWVYLQDASIGDYFSIDSEYVLIVAKAGNVWTVQRGAGSSSAAAHSSTTLYAYCASREFNHPTTNWSWTWDSAADPHGLNTDGTTLRVAYDYDHPTPRTAITVGGDPWWSGKCQAAACYAVRDGVGAMGDAPNVYVSAAPTFAGANGPTAYIERAQDHPSRLQDAAPPSEQKWFIDGRPLSTMNDLVDASMHISGSLYKFTSTTTDGDNMKKLGYNIYVARTSPTTLVAAGNCSTDNPCPIWNDVQLVESIKTPCTITLVSGTGMAWVSRISSGGLAVTASSGLTVTADTCPVTVGSGYPQGSYWMFSWNATAGVWDASGTDERSGSSGYFGKLNRKLIPTWASCGIQPMMDASSSATGDVISDGPADGYKYCIARKGGECRAASQMGDIYMNCPNAHRRPDGSYGCQWFYENWDAAIDMCVGNNSGYLNGIDQMGFARNDVTGGLGRMLTTGLEHYKVIDPYLHGKALADGSWVLLRSMFVNGAWTSTLEAKVPPFPPSDTIDRTTFIPVPVKLTPPAGLAVDNVVVQFGYGENGNPSNFYCTSRHEKCLATASSVPTVPFQFPTDGAGGVETGVAGLSCGSGCTVMVPGISQRMLYYQVKYRDALNRTLASGQVEVVAVP